MLNVTVDHNLDKIQFSWYDYCLFAFMLSGSVFIGIYFGCFGKKQNTAKEYLLGGKTMKAVPIAISLVASHASGLTILAIPADVYKFGSNYAVSFVGVIINCLIAVYITMPVFYTLQITSTYEYLKLRFDTRTRLMASFLFNISMVLYLPIVIYGPALSFAQATPINLHFVNPVICGICIFYTTIGGLKAVVWTDTLQFTAMVGAIAAVLILGISNVGGLETVFERSLRGGRLDIDFSINPTERDTFWAVLIGWSTNWIPHLAIGQGAVQKFIALPSMADVKKALAIFCVGTIFCKATSVLIGLIIYATYYDCDPFALKYVMKNDQLLPYYIMDVGNSIPGLPGLFIAGVFCGALSALSAQMNSLSGTVYEDFVSRYVSKNITEKQVSNILKLIVVVIGVISTGLVFVVEHLGGILSLTIAFSSISAGPLLGLFTLGMIFPSANSKGAFVGSLSSLIFVACMVFGSQYYKASGILQYAEKPSSVESCNANITIFSNNSTTLNSGEDVFVLFRITHYYYTLIGAMVVLIVALPISWFSKNEKPVEEKLITPWMRWAIPKKRQPLSHDDINTEETIKLNSIH